MSVSNNQTSKAFPYSSFMPFYVNGLGISNNATTPNTKLDIAAGTCLDSTGTYQMSIDDALTIDASTNGLNGLDTGTLAASTVYSAFAVTDQVTGLPAGGLISTSQTAPYLPYGYNTFRLIGYIVTDASAHFLKGYWTDNDGSYRLFTYDAPQLAINAGTQTSYTSVSLVTLVPAVNNTPVSLYSNFTANAAADVLNYQGYSSTGDAVTVIAPVAGATAHTTSSNVVLAQLNSSAPSIKYKVSAGSVSAYVQSYQFFL